MNRPKPSSGLRRRVKRVAAWVGWRGHTFVLLAAATVILGIVFISGSNGAAPTSRTPKTVPGASMSDTQTDKSQSKLRASSGRAETTSKTVTTVGSVQLPKAPDIPACRLLSPSIAVKILGSKAQTDFSKSGAGQQSADMEVSRCVYTSGGNGIQLVAHMARSSLGASENSVMFGSEKPSGVQSVQGYGQAAYWNSNSSELNILAENNWYVLSRQQDSASAGLAKVEAVAYVVAPNF